MGSIRLTVRKLRLKQSSNVATEKLPGGHVRTWTEYVWSQTDISEKGGICPVHLEIFFSTLILELRGTKLDEIWTQGSPQPKEKVPKEFFFSNSKISVPILDELEESRFWGNQKKFTKSKGLEPWIHSKAGGR
jgi:hypothetical protein